MKLYSIILFSLLLFSGCVRNIITIYMDPKGSFEMTIHAHGDENDVLDNDFPITNILKDISWDISSTLDSDVDTHDFIATKIFQSNENVPQNFNINKYQSIHPFLKHNIDVNYFNWILWKNYSIEIKFHSREVNKKYPKFINVINNPESEYSGWTEEVFSYLFQETLNRANVEFNKKAIIERDLNTWLQREISTKSDSTIIELFDDLKEEGLDLMMHPINPKIYNEIDSIFNYLETEFRITQLLIDDEFEIRLYLPGILQESNYQNNNLDTLKWEFSLADFMNSDYKIYASSRINYKERIIIMGIISFIIMLILLFRRKK